MAYGDALALNGKLNRKMNGKLQDAIQAYEIAEKINGKNFIAAKKSALLKCFLNIYESMENQYDNLLETINESQDFEKKYLKFLIFSIFRMKKIKDLENLIERNRALPETRLQATLSYEHFTIGPIPGIYLNIF